MTDWNKIINDAKETITAHDLLTRYTPYHGVQDAEKLKKLVEDMLKDGWNPDCSPLVVWDNFCLTGAHRYAAVNEIIYNPDSGVCDSDFELEIIDLKSLAKKTKEIRVACFSGYAEAICRNLTAEVEITEKVWQVAPELAEILGMDAH